MYPKRFSVSLFMALQFADIVQPYPDGAPCMALDTMTPKHDNGRERIKSSFQIRFPDYTHFKCFPPNATIRGLTCCQIVIFTNLKSYNFLQAKACKMTLTSVLNNKLDSP